MQGGAGRDIVRVAESKVRWMGKDEKSSGLDMTREYNIYRCRLRIRKEFRNIERDSLQ